MSSDSGHHEEPPQPTSQPPQPKHQHSTSFNGSSPHFDKVVEDEELDLEELDEEERQQLHDVKEYDPQIRQHLEELNRFATKINQLEKCVEVNIDPIECN